jgi:hypothetical protein
MASFHHTAQRRVECSRQELTVESGEMLPISVRQRFGSGEMVFCVLDGQCSRAALATNGKLLQPFIR